MTVKREDYKTRAEFRWAKKLEHREWNRQNRYWKIPVVIVFVVLLLWVHAGF